MAKCKICEEYRRKLLREYKIKSNTPKSWKIRREFDKHLMFAHDKW